MDGDVKIISGGQAGAERDRARGRARLIDSLVMVTTPLDDQRPPSLAPGFCLSLWLSRIALIRRRGLLQPGLSFLADGSPGIQRLWWRLAADDPIFYRRLSRGRRNKCDNQQDAADHTQEYVGAAVAIHLLSL